MWLVIKGKCLQKAPVKPVVRNAAEEGWERMSVLGGEPGLPEPLYGGGSRLLKQGMFYLLCHAVHQTEHFASFQLPSAASQMRCK